MHVKSEPRTFSKALQRVICISLARSHYCRTIKSQTHVTARAAMRAVERFSRLESGSQATLEPGPEDEMVEAGGTTLEGARSEPT